MLESSLGALGFAGSFRNVASPALRVHTQLGYELARWFLLFGEGELAMTDTAASQGPIRARAFPIFGFGGGARFTVAVTERVSLFVQGGAGLMRADVPVGALAILGYRDAEDFNVYAGGRLGVEWHQINPHLALGLNGGARYAPGFAQAGGAGDTPLLWDASVALRYAF